MMSLADQNVVEKIVFGDEGVASALPERVLSGRHEHRAARGSPASWRERAVPLVTRRSTRACSERPCTPAPASYV